MRAIGNNLVIKKIEKPNQSTKGGLLLTDKQREDVRFQKAEVIKVGETVIAVKEKDIIFFDKAASNKGIVIVSGGAGIDVSYSSGTATVSAAGGSTGSASVVLADATSGVSKSSSGGFDIYTITTATVFGTTTDGRKTMVELQETTNYGTVYAEITRTATTVVVTFKGSITDSDYRALLYNVGT